MKFIFEDKGKSAEEAGFVALPEKDYQKQLDELKEITGKESKDKEEDK